MPMLISTAVPEAISIEELSSMSTVPEEMVVTMEAMSEPEKTWIERESFWYDLNGDELTLDFTTEYEDVDADLITSIEDLGLFDEETVQLEEIKLKVEELSEIYKKIAFLN